MTAHTHTERVAGCHRCELGADEAESAMQQEIADLEADVAALSRELRALRSALKSKIIGFESLIRSADGVLADHGVPPPRLSDFAGAFPDLTDGMDSVEYVRQQRDRT